MSQVIAEEVRSQATTDSMTAEERLQATIAFKPVDRVVCGPFIYGYAASFCGITQAQFVNNFEVAMRCLDQVKAANPIWDLCRSAYSDLGHGPSLRNRWFQKVAVPGYELPEDLPVQIIEEPLATQDDLREIKKTGLTKYMMKVTKRIRPTKGLIHFLLWEFRRNRMHRREADAALARGQAFHYGGTYASPFETFSMTRGLSDFNSDMYRLKDELVDIMWAVQQPSIDMALKSCKNSRVNRVFVVGCRNGTTFLSKKNFEKYSWPWLKDGALKLIEAGATPIFHLDTDWGRALEYFFELPKQKFIIETDGLTDLFRAREILKDHVCLSGDVPPAMLTVGSPSEVDDYCRRLITTVGKDGGFILSNGCTVPHNAKHENVKAMFDSVEKYGRYN